jgi:hypothetical protein
MAGKQLFLGICAGVCPETGTVTPPGRTWFIASRETINLSHNLEGTVQKQGWNGNCTLEKRDFTFS